VDLDEELAKKLQEEMYKEQYGGYGNGSYGNKSWPYYGNSGGYGGYSQPHRGSSSASFTPVKPPPLSELKKVDSSSAKDKSEDSDIVCLICHQSPSDYIILPSCQSPHIYWYHSSIIDI
jgi:hypothetical protein